MSAEPGWRIRPLVQTSGHIPTLVAWFEAEWALWYGPDGPGDARADLDSAARHNGLPYAVIAIDNDDELLGTAALRPDSVGDELAPGPWLAAIYVPPHHRGQGVGTALVAAIEQAAAAQDHPAVYTSTETAAGIMVRRGWRSIGETHSLRGPITVFEKRLTPLGRAAP